MSDKDRKRQKSISAFFFTKKQKTDDAVSDTGKGIEFSGIPCASTHAATTSMPTNPSAASASTSYMLQQRDIGEYCNVCVFQYFRVTANCERLFYVQLILRSPQLHIFTYKLYIHTLLLC